MLAELEALTGRAYPVVDASRRDDTDAAGVLLNSAAETAKEAADRLRAGGQRVGVLSPNVLRPFPAQELRDAFRGVRAVLVGDRGDSYGAGGGTLGLEVRAALQQDPESRTLVLNRIYGLGGRDFYDADAEEFFAEALEAARQGSVAMPFAYHGTYAGEPGQSPPKGLPAIATEEVSRGMAKVTPDAKTGRLRVELEPPWAMTAVPPRVAPRPGGCW